jgi:23S rRNA (uracil1939-C5)-methyltransferase
MSITIVRLGHLGDGIAEDGTFAAATLPGEVIEGAVEDGRIAAPRILTPSPQRIRPPCAQARACGGCALQHASDDFVARWKAGVIETALAAQGLEAEVRPTQTSPARSRQRATLAARRGKSGPIVGFHRRASDDIIAPADCHLLHPDLAALLPLMGQITARAASRTERLDITLTRSLSGADVAIRGARAPDAALIGDLAAMTAGAGVARIAWNGETLAQHTRPEVALGRARVALPPGAFLQATAHGAEALLAAVRAAIGPARRIADLFAGLGTFALPLAETAEVWALDGDAAMIAALDEGARHAPGLHALRAEARDLFRRPLLAAEMARLDAVVIDPPRAGASAQVAELAQSAVPVIAMISCNPISFARDARTLVAGGYRLDWVQPVDQFRWSTHVELAARLSRA